MKKRVIFLFISIVFLMNLMLISSACNLGISMINQDPYPANPGDYVKVVFRIEGVGNPECGMITFEINEEYPFYLDPDVENPISIKAGTYDRKYSSFYLAPYQIRVDPNALNGDTPIEVSSISSTSDTKEIKSFNINVKDTRADFEIFVKDYDKSTGIMTFQVLNIGENDIEALTIEIPNQENISIKGPNTDILGDLDSNEYTTAEFEASSRGGIIKLDIRYTDSINVRREKSQEISFDPSYFEGRKNGKKIGIWTYFIIIAILAGIGYWIYRKRKKSKMRHAHHQKHSFYNFKI